MLGKTIAVLSTGIWGRKLARNIHKDLRFSLISLIANFANDDEIWDYADKKTPLHVSANHNGLTKELIREKLIEHGLMPRVGDEDDEVEESPAAHDKTVDLVVLDMGLELNSYVITQLENHVRIRILAHAASSDDKKQLGKLGAVAVCPDIDGHGADYVIPLLVESYIKVMGNELGEWHGAVMPVPNSWTGKTVAEAEAQFGIGIIFVRSEETVEQKGKRKETKKSTFRPEKNYVFREEDLDMKVVSRNYEKILKIEAEIEKKIN